MQPFEYARPASLDETISMLSDTWGETELLAGGSDLVTALKQHISTPKRVVSLRDVDELKGIEVDGDGIHIGAMTTLADLADHAAARERFPSLVGAIEGIGSRQVIAVGAVGGDLCQRPRCWYFRNGHGLLAVHEGKSLVVEGDNRCHAIFGNEGPAYFVSPSSLGPPLIALGATVTIAGPKGKTREVAAADFFRAPQSERERETALRPNEVVAAVHVPTNGMRNATYEVRHRHGLDWPYATASVAFKLNGGRASGASVVLGHVAPVPWPATEAAKALEGATVDEAVAAKAGEAATAGARPLSRNGYKVQMVKTAVKRAVMAAAGLSTEV